MRFVLSTIGTSILTNLIDRGNAAEGTWFGVLRDSANLKPEELDKGAETVINTLADRALEKLLENDIKTNRRISAELNGIYGIYDGQLPENSSDQHYLICTDTAQGQQTGKLIGDFLMDRFSAVNIVTPSQLSTKDTEVFATGTKELIKWLEENVPWRRESGYRVIFNLVGGFKSLQGYMQTFGAFYADEIVYIFEGSSDLIKIPCLPIRVDTTVIQRHRTQFAMMTAGTMYPIDELTGVPGTLLEIVEDEDQICAGLSAWGELIWNQTKSNLLTKELLQFQRLEYADSFIDDHNNTRDNGARVTLQETLAKIAFTLEKNEGNPIALFQGGLRFEKFKTHTDIYRFRITQSIRASCKVEADGLILVHYGQHEYVDNVSHAPYCSHC